jgi:hypothetical protein
MSKLATLKEATAICPRTGYRYRVRYGFDGAFAAQHKQPPHLSVTCSIDEPRPGGYWRDVGGGVLSAEDAARVFPGHPLVALVPFHLCDAPTGAPMHYPGNVLFLAGERDCWGTLKGERRPIRNGRTGAISWELRIDDGTEHGAPMPSRTYGVEGSGDKGETPPAPIRTKWVPRCREGEGKARELDAARRCAVWPDATDAELSAPTEELRAVLLARLPALCERMRAACEAAGVGWPNERGEV